MNLKYPFSISELKFLLEFDWNYLRKLKDKKVIIPHSNRPFAYSWQNLIVASFLYFLKLDNTRESYNFEICQNLGDFLKVNNSYILTNKIVSLTGYLPSEIIFLNAVDFPETSIILQKITSNSELNWHIKLTEDRNNFKMEKTLFFYYLHLDNLSKWLLQRAKDKSALQAKIQALISS